MQEYIDLEVLGFKEGYESKQYKLKDKKYQRLFYVDDNVDKVRTIISAVPIMVEWFKKTHGIEITHYTINALRKRTLTHMKPDNIDLLERFRIEVEVIEEPITWERVGD